MGAVEQKYSDVQRLLEIAEQVCTNLADTAAIRDCQNKTHSLNGQMLSLAKQTLTQVQNGLYEAIHVCTDIVVFNCSVGKERFTLG